MAFFDSDKSVNNSKLKEIDLLVAKKVSVTKKKGILYYEKGNVTLEVAGVLKETKEGTIEGKIIALAVKDGDDKPVWDLSNFSYDANKIENQLRDGKRDKVIAKIFEGKDTIWGSPEDDKLFGYSGKDKVVGWQGNDRINGGPGKDTLTGDYEGKQLGYTGDDVFVFDQPFRKNNVDTITDFNVKHDSIELSKKIFKGFKKGSLKESQFNIGKQKGDDPQVIYNKFKGHLFYDPDGIGPKDAAKFATMGKNKALTHDDFFVA